ncbi:MAG TPA: TetR family transcriptional regulator [Kofleriaceae bacterium]|jgi:AcrR family transcriptional regulator
MRRRSRKPVTAPRKLPVQARSARLVADILEAAVRVLEREGAQRFTTIRVAETAGVSVGSLYQYFPNKQSILYRLQVEEWEQTGATIDAILGDTTQPPQQRLRTMIRAFFHSECEEAPLRNALDAATPDYHAAPESRAKRERGRHVVRRFLAAAAPRATPRQRAHGAELVFMTMTSVGKQLSERRPTKAEVNRVADAIASMLTWYLAQLGG